MKTKLLVFCVFLIIISLVIISCSGSVKNYYESTASSGDSDVPAPSKPAAPQIVAPVNSSLSAYVFNNKEGVYNEISGAVVKRMTNIKDVLDDSIKTVIVSGKDVADISADQYKAIAKIYSNWGNIIISEPAISEWNNFIIGIANAFQELVNNGEYGEAHSYVVPIMDSVINDSISKSVDLSSETLYIDKMDETHTDNHFCDMVIIRGGETFIMADMYDHDNNGMQLTYNIENHEYDLVKDSNGNLVKDTTKDPVITTSQTTINLDSLSNEHSYANGEIASISYNLVNNDKGEEEIKTDSKPSAASSLYTAQNAYDISANSIVEMLNKQPESKEQTEKLIIEGEKLFAKAKINEASVKDLMKAQTKTVTFWVKAVKFENWMALVTVTHDIWSLNNLQDGEHNKDYYIVHQYIKSANRGMFFSNNCDKYHWSRPDKKHHYYGSYMRELISENSLVGSGNLVDYSPHTDSSSTSVSSGMSWNLGGSVGFSGTNLTGGVSGGVSFSESKTVNIKDLTLRVNSSNANPTWTYTGARPMNHYAIHCYHDEAGDQLVNDCVVEHYWLWQIDKPSGKYTLNNTVKITPETLEATSGFFKMNDIYHFLQHSNTVSIPMDTPSRSSIDLSIFYEDKSGKLKYGDLDDFLTTYYPKLWKTQQTIYLASKDNTQALTNYITQFKNTLENTKQYWIARGFDGTYKFDFRTGETSGTVFDSFEFSPAKN